MKFDVAPLWLHRYLVPFAWATLAANIAIVVSGGVVRITGSGLGCPTWPQCTEDSFVPHGELGIHGAIEFGNRMITFAIAAIAIATWLASRKSPQPAVRRLSLVLALGVPLQAVIGGISVLTKLNPWVVAGHLLLSMAMVMLSVLLLLHLKTREVRADEQVRLLRPLGWALLATSWVVLYTGTMVTGAGPHAGDVDAPRNGLDTEALSQLHADAVMLLIGLTLAGFLCARLLPLTDVARRALRVLLGLEIAQATIGFTQYFLGVPEALVAAHLLGSALTAAATAWFAFGANRTSLGLLSGHDTESARAEAALASR